MDIEFGLLTAAELSLRIGSGTVDPRLGNGMYPEGRLIATRECGSKLINARSESILDKPSFRKAAVKRRALVPAEGCYEWQKTEDGKKLPVQDQPGHDFDDRFQTLGADIVGRDGTEQEAGAPAVAR
ncbi:MAG: hypothetical protein JWM01_1886 [Arthrobacter sp.]|nr:hypothetical protein [Arthrobacter sp.]